MNSELPPLRAAQEAWQSVLGQLQMEMPRASFDNWVRDTRLFSYDEQAATMTIAARNAYACEWLEARLTSTVSRLLAGMLNRGVEVRFVVADEIEAGEEDDREDADEEESDEIAIEPVQFLDYEQIVQPHRQIVVKGYLKRLGKEIGPKAIWLYIGFHQAAWKAASAKGSFPVHSREVLRYSGLSKSAFWRLLKRQDIRDSLKGLVERVDPQPIRLYQRGKDGRPHRAPVRYRVHLTPRLTVSDAHTIYRLMKNGTDDSLVEVLQNLLKCPNLLDGLPLLLGDLAHFSHLHTVWDVVQAVSGGNADEQARKLSQEIHRRIVNGLGEIHIRHYFVERVIPHYKLTPAQAWLVTVARDMAYLNWRTGERRETVRFIYGFSEMAHLVGLNRYKTIQEWFSPNWKAGKKGGDLSALMSLLGTGDTPLEESTRSADMPRYFHVEMDEPIVDANGGNTLDADGSNSQTPMEAIADADGGNMVDANGGVKNTLNTSINTQKSITSTTRKEQNAAEAAVIPERWELKDLLQQNKVHPKVQKELLDSQASVRAFVSWVLYACSPQASKLSDPLGYALSQLRANPMQGAGIEYERFAAFPPQSLLSLIDSTSSIQRSSNPLWPAWKKTMGERNPAVQKARDILFGKGAS